MKLQKMVSIFLIIFLLNSCGWVPPKTSHLDSLLDYGSLEELTTKSDNSKSTADLFKGASGIHHGIDISHFQGNIMDTYTAKDSLSFVICKATQGQHFVDPQFRHNWNTIKEKGLVRGAYHFYVCSVSPEIQAEHFATTASDIGLSDIAPILDIEKGSMSKGISGDQMEKDILVFLKLVQKKLNRKPILYTNYAFAQEFLKNPEFANYDLWLAEYTKSPKPKVPDTWKEKGYKIWQRSQSYHINSKTVDLDIYTGLLSEIVK